MAIPEAAKPGSLAGYLAIMSRAIFQAGLSWKMIESKWSDYLRLFENFDPARVAHFGEGDIQTVMSDGAVPRTYKKIAGVIKNAKTMLELEREYGGFANYLHAHASYEALAKDLKKRFKFMGPLNAYYFLFLTCEPVPRFEDWEKTVDGDHPRMRETVALGRERGTSTETR